SVTFLDDHKSLKQKVYEELKEEVGISRNKVASIILGEIFHQEAPKYKKTWIVHPVLVNVKTDQIRLDWEARNCKWATIGEIKRMKLLPGFDRVIVILTKTK
ncbi:MAG: NUDIX hydrolase, partial [Patescibacteria group bacterium]|nr:NUDIX hydrolase [Patescibacteria group bacterium]